MKRGLILLALLALSFGARAAEVVAVPPWELHSSFWMSLHQRLIEDAMRSASPTRPELAPEERDVWAAAVATYRTAGGHGNMTFARPMVITTDALTQVSDDASELLIDAPLTDALVQAAPVYRRYWWTTDDRASRFFIEYAVAMLREAGDLLIQQHEAAYQAEWPERIRTYITPVAGPFGAYTIKGLAGGLVTTMSYQDQGYQGFRALEMLLHEASHGIVGPNRGTIAEAIKVAAGNHDVDVPRELWHAILFATSSELARRALADLGVGDFIPSSVDMFSRVWPQYRAPVEKHWIAYLDGKGTLEQAIENIVVEASR